MSSKVGLRAVVFDYGMVLTGPPDPKAYAELLRITGLSSARLDSFYWADRHAYDEGTLTGFAFWQKIAGDAGLDLKQSDLEELNLWDARMWTTQNDAMLAWQLELKKRGFLTAILSNLGDTVHANIEREFAWLSRFDVLVWSYRASDSQARRSYLSPCAQGTRCPAGGGTLCRRQAGQHRLRKGAGDEGFGVHDRGEIARRPDRAGAGCGTSASRLRI